MHTHASAKLSISTIMTDDESPNAEFYVELKNARNLLHLVAGVCGIQKRGCLLVNSDGFSMNVSWYAYLLIYFSDK